MNVNRENDLMRKLWQFENSYTLCINLIKSRDQTIAILQQENEDLKGQLRQWGIDSTKLADNRKKNDQGFRKGLFLH